jgi:hypothetical protein
MARVDRSAAAWCARPRPLPRTGFPCDGRGADAKSLELLAGSPVNCLLINEVSADFVAAANDRKLVTLALIPAGADALASARRALDAKVSGIVLEGEFPKVRQPKCGKPRAMHR